MSSIPLFLFLVMLDDLFFHFLMTSFFCIVIRTPVIPVAVHLVF